MFFLDPNNQGLVDVKDLADKAKTFEDAEHILFSLMEIDKKIGHVPIARARINRLIARAQKSRREAGNSARFATSRP